jgi:hypothetical protein
MGNNTDPYFEGAKHLLSGSIQLNRNLFIQQTEVQFTKVVGKVKDLICNSRGPRAGRTLRRNIAKRQKIVIN